MRPHTSVTLRVSHYILMSSDRMKPRSGNWASEVQSARAKADLPFPPTETRGLSPLTLTGMNEHHLSAQSMLVNPASVIVQNAAVSVAPLSVRRRYCETTHLDCVASKWGSPSKSGLYLTYDP
uniref:Uncharacterized protein n=1 Tax=Timema bartmani TaxID=61472 RepID=A0A7R9EQS3_9NEOP|nr:unnamed protein product [Timema bartmani]